MTDYGVASPKKQQAHNSKFETYIPISDQWNLSSWEGYFIVPITPDDDLRAFLFVAP